LDDHLDKAAGQLRAELAARREADVELEALRDLATQVRDLVLDFICEEGKPRCITTNIPCLFI
jgi:hypothetical protein